MTTNTQTPLKEKLEQALEAPPGKESTINISLGENIEFICETKPDETGTGKTVIAYTEQLYEITIKSLIATLDQSIADLLVPSLRIVATSVPFTLKEIRNLNEKIPENMALAVPAKEKTTGDAKETTTGDETIIIRKGFSFSGRLGLPDIPYILSLPVSPEEEGQEVPPAPSEEEDKEITPSKLAVWFTIEKAFGPFLLKQIGFQYRKKEDKGELAVLFDAVLQVSSFTLTCDDLSIGIPLIGKSKPAFGIAGIGIEFKTKNLEVGGALLLREREDTNGDSIQEYIGTASIKFKLTKNKTFGVSAIGAYTYYDNEPSLFLYALLEFAIGAPPIFVTGFSQSHHRIWRSIFPLTGADQLGNLQSLFLTGWNKYPRLRNPFTTT